MSSAGSVSNAGSATLNTARSHSARMCDSRRKRYAESSIALWKATACAGRPGFMGWRSCNVGAAAPFAG